MNLSKFYFHCNIVLLSATSSVLFLLNSCGGASNKIGSGSSLNPQGSKDGPGRIEIKSFTNSISRQRIKLGHFANTTANEYLPVTNSEGTFLYFSAMDRTGYFDFKLDFTIEKSAGGEDVFYSALKEGIWADARPLTNLNTNGHEVVTQVLENGDFMVTGNYPETYGVLKNQDEGTQTTDLFFVSQMQSKYQINHFPEPVNSIYTEADGYIANDKSFILFVSDRKGNQGEYHKKGWKWNESYWGNTDVYVSVRDGNNWTVPMNLGPKINTQFAERTPWISSDGLVLYLSSNGYISGKTDLDVYAFKRKSLEVWNDWEGPFKIGDANTPYDDWGYKETNNGDAFVSSADKLSFTPTQSGAAGDGGLRETNFRPGYQVFGLQIASLNREFEFNIYQLKPKEKPLYVVNDMFFEFNSFAIKKSFVKYLLLLVDQIAQNKEVIIEIEGHTDNIGNAEYNLRLSKKRADALKTFLELNGVKNKVITRGFGDQKPAFSNITPENRSKNRRVELFINR